LFSAQTAQKQQKETTGLDASLANQLAYCALKPISTYVYRFHRPNKLNLFINLTSGLPKSIKQTKVLAYAKANQKENYSEANATDLFDQKQTAVKTNRFKCATNTPFCLCPLHPSRLCRGKEGKGGKDPTPYGAKGKSLLAIGFCLGKNPCSNGLQRESLLEQDLYLIPKSKAVLPVFKTLKLMPFLPRNGFAGGAANLDCVNQTIGVHRLKSVARFTLTLGASKPSSLRQTLSIRL
jgi:hypothetical protein